MKNLIQFCAVLLLAAPSFAGSFVVGATEKGVDTIYVKPIGAADGCHVVTAAEVVKTERVIPRILLPKQRVCKSGGTETVYIIENGKQVAVERPLPAVCEYCDRGRNGTYINCTKSNVVIVQPADMLITANSVELNIEPSEDLICAGIASDYIALPVTPGHSMTITMPDSVKLLDMKQTLTETDKVLENVIYKTLERMQILPANN